MKLDNIVKQILDASFIYSSNHLAANMAKLNDTNVETDPVIVERMDGAKKSLEAALKDFAEEIKKEQKEEMRRWKA